MMSQTYLRPAEAAEYLTKHYKFGSAKTLAKHRTIGGGPLYQKIGERVVLYTQQALDEWARSKISVPVSSTSELEVAK